MSRARYRIASLLIAAVHLGLVWHAASVYSVVHDEGPHLAAGLKFWKTGKSDWYVVNPPLVRNTATIAALPFSLQTDWPDYQTAPRSRPEYVYGRQILQLNGELAWRAIIASRLISSLWSVAGLLLCGVTALRTAGPIAGCVAQILWCICPTMIGHGALLVPDVAGATGLLIGCLGFVHWLDRRTFDAAVVVGLTTAIALLTKNTLFVLPPIFLLVWLVRSSRGTLLAEIGQVAVAMLICVFLINVVYGFHGSFVSLGKYEFVSDLLGGAEDPRRQEPGNVFRETALSNVPVPLPMDYILGFDVQRIDFIDRSRLMYYLLGEWSRTGWWHYYVVGVLCKTPVAILLLAAWGLGIALRRERFERRTEFLVVALACSVVFALVSSQTGLNQHTRYVIPALPLLFILGGIAVASCQRRPARWLGYALVAIAAMGSLMSYPHCISFFNWPVRMLTSPDRVLLHTNLDYGQDIGFIARWAERHPGSRPLFLSLYCRRVPPSIYGVDCDRYEISLEPRNANTLEFERFEAATYVVSVMNLRWPGTIYQRALDDRAAR